MRKKQSVMEASSPGTWSGRCGQRGPLQASDLLLCEFTDWPLSILPEVESTEQVVAEVVLCVLKSAIIIVNNHPGVLFMLQVISFLPEEC